MEKLYKRRYRRMVAEIGENLSMENCAKIGFMYGDTISRSYLDLHGKSGLKLLEKMQDTDEFSFDEPNKLATIMEDLGFMDKKNIVEAFIRENHAMISTLHQPDDSYIRFIPHLSPRMLRSNSSSTSKSSDQSSMDDDEPIYSEPYMPVNIEKSIIVKSSFQESFPLHKEVLKLLVKPMRDIIDKGKNTIVTSDVLECKIPQSRFYLVFLSGDRKQPYISADLYLKPGSQIEEDVRSYHLLTELQVGQRGKKKKSYQNFYSHSVLMNTPTKPHLPIQEQGEEEELTQHQSRRTEDVKEEGHLVASFHAIMSHTHFMNRMLITRPYLTLVFTLTSYPQ